MTLLSDAAGDPSGPLSWLPLDVVTPGALLGLAVWLLLTGKIVPRRTLEDHLKEIGFLRETIENLQAVKLELAKQNTRLLGDKDLSVQILQSGRSDMDAGSGDNSNTGEGGPS